MSGACQGPGPPPAIAHVNFNGQDWYLVRRVSRPGTTWHPADDNLQGTSVYGQPTTDPLAVSVHPLAFPAAGCCLTETAACAGQDDTFSIAFSAGGYSSLLFASGDLSMWVQMSRATVQGFSDPNVDCKHCTLPLEGSSEGGRPVQQYMRSDCCPEDPWISAGDHPAKIVCEHQPPPLNLTQSHGLADSRLLAAAHLSDGEGGWKGHNTNDALNFGGANVWVNSLAGL